tara:strand:- start:623 stop:1930 length:1308 start_codon:yes stop_codon:yes gene_type:complete
MRLIALFLFLLLPPSYSGQVFSSLEAVENKNNTLISNAAGSDEKIIKTVTASGYGTSVDAAAQNAAENALTQVVGSFIDAETQIKKQKEIRDGVISKTKVIKKDIKDYSQGSIKSFEILNVQQNGSIYNVTARVDVRVEDFRAYIKELAYGSTIVKSNLFTQIATEKENKDSKRDILTKKVLRPIMQGEVVEIKIGAPQSLDAFYSSNYCTIKVDDYYLNITREEECSETGTFRYLDKSKTIIMPVSFKLKDNFLENIKNILENISNDKIELLKNLPQETVYWIYESFKQPKEWEKNVNRYEVVIKSKEKYSMFFLPDIIPANKYSLPPYTGIKNFDYDSSAKDFNNIRVKVLDNKGNILIGQDFGPGSSKMGSGNSFQFKEKKWGWGKPSFSLYTPNYKYRVNIIHNQRDYWLAIEMDIDILKKTNSISIEYIQ